MAVGVLRNYPGLPAELYDAVVREQPPEPRYMEVHDVIH
jgi:hypothetical protein